MAASFNKVIILGNLTRDPELKYTAQGTTIANFSIAVNRSYKDKDGDFKKEVAYFKIVVWGKTGESCSKYLSKGRPVLVEGRLNNNSWEDKDGNKRVTTEIVADSVSFLGSVDNGGHDNSGETAQPAEPFTGEEDDDDANEPPPF